MMQKESAAITSVNKADIHSYINRNPKIFEAKFKGHRSKKGGGHWEWWVNDSDTGERLNWPSRDSEDFYGKGREYGVQMSLTRGSGQTERNEGKLFRDILHLLGRLDDFPSLARKWGNTPEGVETSEGAGLESRLLPHWTRNIIGILQKYEERNDQNLIQNIRRSVRQQARYLTDGDIKDLFEKVKDGYKPAEISEAEVLVAIQLLNMDGEPASRSNILDILSRKDTKENIDDLSYNLQGLLGSGQVTGGEDSYETPLLEKNSDFVLMQLKKLAKFLRNKQS